MGRALMAIDTNESCQKMNAQLKADANLFRSKAKSFSRFNPKRYEFNTRASRCEQAALDLLIASLKASDLVARGVILDD